MDCEKLKDAVKKIELSDEARSRIISNCQTTTYKTEENAMNKMNVRFKRPVAVAVILSLCLCLTAVAAAASHFGFFKDITNWNGAIVGTRYEQASKEIAVDASLGEKGMVVTAVMLYPDNAPYNEQESLGIDSYHIIDMSGNIAVEGGRTEFFEIVNGKAEITIPLNDLTSGEYKLIIDAFVGSKKADQPLLISGAWECGFSF